MDQLSSSVYNSPPVESESTTIDQPDLYQGSGGYSEQGSGHGGLGVHETSQTGGYDREIYSSHGSSQRGQGGAYGIQGSSQAGQNDNRREHSGIYGGQGSRQGGQGGRYGGQGASETGQGDRQRGQGGRYGGQSNVDSTYSFGGQGGSDVGRGSGQREQSGRGSGSTSGGQTGQEGVYNRGSDHQTGQVGGYDYREENRGRIPGGSTGDQIGIPDPGYNHPGVYSTGDGSDGDLEDGDFGSGFGLDYASEYDSYPTSGVVTVSPSIINLPTNSGYDYDFYNTDNPSNYEYEYYYADYDDSVRTKRQHHNESAPSKRRVVTKTTLNETVPVVTNNTLRLLPLPTNDVEHNLPVHPNSVINKNTDDETGKEESNEISSLARKARLSEKHRGRIKPGRPTHAIRPGRPLRGTVHGRSGSRVPNPNRSNSTVAQGNRAHVNGYPKLNTLRQLAKKWRAKRHQLQRRQRDVGEDLTWI